jgi:catechol 2,3-dioxygenase-like lactoylglutathione lyase family enzyme
VRVETVDFLAIPTRDIERSVRWYTEVLGLERGAEGEVETPNVTISFWSPESDGEEFKPHLGGFGVRVADVEEARGVCHMGFFEYPDGNTIILHRRYKPRG